jgi:hypothetical protein
MSVKRQGEQCPAFHSYLWNTEINQKLFLLAYCSGFEKIKVGFSDHHALCVSVNSPHQRLNV